MFVLDTNVVSELRKAKAGKADRNVATWAASVPAAALFVSAITILELETGVLLVQRRDPKQGALLRGCRRKQHLARYALIEACKRGVVDGDEDAKRATRAPWAPSRSER